MARRHRPPPRRPSSRGPLWLAIGALIVVALAAFVLWPRAEETMAASDPSAHGRVVVTKPQVDLGRVPLDVVVEARYELINTGGKEVRLLGAPVVKTLEGC